jgi:site-specific recombinase XerC
MRSLEQLFVMDTCAGRLRTAAPTGSSNSGRAGRPFAVRTQAIGEFPYGRRDHALLLVAVQTGLRLSELTGLRREDMQLGTAAHVRCVGKGRRERCTPLTKQAQVAMKAWSSELPKSMNWLFPNAQGGRLSADAVQRLLAKYERIACDAVRP